MKYLKTLITCLVLACCHFTALSQSSGFDILTIGPNTEALGLNEATTAYLLGASDIYSNPANLAFESSSSFNADYSLWIGDLTNTHVAAAFKRPKGTFAVGLMASEANDFELRDRPGPAQGSFNISYLSLAAGYAYTLQNLSAGLSFQYLREELYIYNASGYAFNMGISGRWLDDKLHLSAALKNLGEMNELNNDPTLLPSQFRAGVNAMIWNFTSGTDDSFPILVSLISDFIVPILTETSSETGTESTEYLTIALSIEAADIITIRGGYKTGDTERPISLGTGVTINNIHANYALVPFKTGFGTVHSVGISYRF